MHALLADYVISCNAHSCVTLGLGRAREQCAVLCIGDGRGLHCFNLQTGTVV